MSDAVLYGDDALMVRLVVMFPEPVKTELGARGRLVDSEGNAEFVDLDGSSCIAVDVIVVSEALELRDKLRELEEPPGAGEVDRKLSRVVDPPDDVNERLLWTEPDFVVDPEPGTELLYEYSDAEDDDANLVDVVPLPEDVLTGDVCPLGGVFASVVEGDPVEEGPREPDEDVVARDSVGEDTVADNSKDDVGSGVNVEVLGLGTSEVVTGNASGAMANCSPFAGPILVTSA